MGTRRLVTLGLLILLGASAAAGQAPGRLLVAVTDAEGAPLTGLTPADFTLTRDGGSVETLAVEPLPAAVQVVAVFEGLAVTQRQLNAAIATLIGSLDAQSVVDMQSVDSALDAAIVQAIEDLHARGATHPVVLLLGQDSEMARSDLPSSQVRGRRRAADLADIGRLAEMLADHGIPFYGVSVTTILLPNLEALAAGSGGRFHVIAAASDLADTLRGIGAELGARYVVSHAGTAPPEVSVTRPGATVHAVPYAPTH